MFSQQFNLQYSSSLKPISGFNNDILPPHKGFEAKNALTWPELDYHLPIDFVHGR